jgi:hypothetical protein
MRPFSWGDVTPVGKSSRKEKGKATTRDHESERRDRARLSELFFGGRSQAAMIMRCDRPRKWAVGTPFDLVHRASPRLDCKHRPISFGKFTVKGGVMGDDDRCIGSESGEVVRIRSLLGHLEFAPGLRILSPSRQPACPTAHWACVVDGPGASRAFGVAATRART